MHRRRDVAWLVGWGVGDSISANRNESARATGTRSSRHRGVQDAQGSRADPRTHRSPRRADSQRRGDPSPPRTHRRRVRNHVRHKLSLRIPAHRFAAAPAGRLGVGAHRHDVLRDAYPRQSRRPPRAGHRCRFRSHPTYETTKLLAAVFAAELNRRTHRVGITANAADPGFVRTNLGRHTSGAFRLFLTLTRQFQATPQKAATTAVYLATTSQAATIAGGYYTKSRPGKTSPLAQDPEFAHQLWAQSSTLLTTASIATPENSPSKAHPNGAPIRPPSLHPRSRRSEGCLALWETRL